MNTRSLNEVKIEIKDVEVRGPFTNKKTGNQFDTHVYITEDGKEFFQFSKVDAEPELKAGDVVTAYIETQKSERGESNKITKILNKSSLSSHPPRSAGRMQQAISGKIQSFDPKGARTGMIVKASLDLAIHNSGSDQVGKKELASALKLVQELTKEAEKE